jgi:hypothetical protein
MAITERVFNLVRKIPRAHHQTADALGSQLLDHQVKE